MSDYIACGHGKSTDGSWDPGCTYKAKGKTYTEADLMLQITKWMVKYLRGTGLAIKTDADNNNNINMIKSVEAANKAGVEAYVSLHCDWSKAKTGTMPLYYSAKGKALAAALDKSVRGHMGIKCRGITKRPDLYELTGTDAVACIFETGGIKADLKTLQQADEYGWALARGFCDYKGKVFNFKIKAKGNLIVRKTSSLLSKKIKTLEKGEAYTIVATNAKGTRGKLKDGGWITITDKYIERV